MNFSALLQHVKPNYQTSSEHFTFAFYGGKMSLSQYAHLKSTWVQTNYFVGIKKEEYNG